MKKRIILSLLLIMSICLSACGKKEEVIEDEPKIIQENNYDFGIDIDAIKNQEANIIEEEVSEKLVIEEFDDTYKKSEIEELFGEESDLMEYTNYLGNDVTGYFGFNKEIEKISDLNLPNLKDGFKDSISYLVKDEELGDYNVIISAFDGVYSSQDIKILFESEIKPLFTYDKVTSEGCYDFNQVIVNPNLSGTTYKFYYNLNGEYFYYTNTFIKNEKGYTTSIIIFGKKDSISLATLSVVDQTFRFIDDKEDINIEKKEESKYFNEVDEKNKESNEEIYWQDDFVEVSSKDLEFINEDESGITYLYGDVAIFISWEGLAGVNLDEENIFVFSYDENNISKDVVDYNKKPYYVYYVPTLYLKTDYGLLVIN